MSNCSCYWNSILSGHGIAMPFFGYELPKESCCASRNITRLQYKL